MPDIKRHQSLTIALLVIGELCYLHMARSEICVNSTCTYKFTVSIRRTMTILGSDGVTYDVTLIGSKLFIKNGTEEVSPADVITADGFRRDVLTVNGKYPGPPIEVTEGATVIVEVINNLTHPLSIHFHGLEQFNTWFMDGAGEVTQCPIPPGGKFTHRFTASPVGTHWYHEHELLAYADGLYGLFIVHRRANVPPLQPNFLVTVNDWYHQRVSELYSNVPHLCQNGAVGGSLKPPGHSGCWIDGTDLNPSSFVSALFGGRGRWQNRSFPLSEYRVQSSSTYRFRVVNSGFWFPLQISVDGHKIRIVASDGGDLEPITVDSFFIYVGERIDFELDANQPPDRYWMRAKPACVDDEAKAILAYDTINSTDDPNSHPVSCTAENLCTIFNCPFQQIPSRYNSTCITMGQANSTLPLDELRTLYGVDEPEENVLSYFLNFAMVVGGSINARRFRFPDVPFFEVNPPPCSAEPCVDSCNCQCTHTLTLPYNRTVQFIISNLQPNESIFENGAENVHFHSTKFAVLAQRFPTYDSVSGHWKTANTDVLCRSELCWNATWTSGSPPSFRNVLKPPVKDTIVIPTRGYLVLRFRTTNPGPFMLHCHLDSHVIGGMAMIIDVAPEMRASPPPDFPRCGPQLSTVRPRPLPTANESKKSCANLEGRKKRLCKRNRILRRLTKKKISRNRHKKIPRSS